MTYAEIRPIEAALAAAQVRHSQDPGELAVADHTHDINEISGAYEKADRYHDHDRSELWSYIHGLREDLAAAENRISELESAIAKILGS